MIKISIFNPDTANTLHMYNFTILSSPTDLKFVVNSSKFKHTCKHLQGQGPYTVCFWSKLQKKKKHLTASDFLFFAMEQLF